MDPTSVREALGLDATFTPWLEELERLAPEPAPAPLPGRAAADAELRRLGVAEADIPVVLNARPDHDALAWIVDREHHVLTSTLGELGMLGWPPLHNAESRSTQLVHVWSFLAALPAVREYHADRRVGDDVSWATLADLGQNMYENHLLFGDTGLDVPWWLTLHFRGAIYKLGRLQFERFRTSGAVPGTSAGDAGLGLHIPETGPMTPEGCDASIAWAHEFFPVHFPDEEPVIGTCSSWLLDPQLAEYLPDDSNIVQFQRRFTLRPDKSSDDNAGICRFVFHDPAPDLDAVPQETTLQRAIVSHIRAGRSWRVCAGWFRW